MTPPFASCQVLLVEDNVADAELVAEQLDGAIHIEHVERLVDALTRVSTDAYDAVLLDLGLPDSKGVGAVKRLLDVDDTLAIVVLTGLNDEVVGMAAVRSGAQDFVVKGTASARALSKTVRYAVERSRWQRQLVALVSRNADAMIVVDSATSTVLHMNQAARRMFELGDLTIGSQFPYALETKTSSIVETPTDRSEVRHAQMRVAEVQWSRSHAYLISLRDITDLRRAQELEQRLLHADRLASIGQLAAGVAHEINNPSTFVRANLEAALRSVSEIRATHDAIRSALRPHGADSLRAFDAVLAERGSARLFDDLETMLSDSLEGAGRITSIVQDLSSFSRIDRDEIEWVDLNDVVRVAVNMVRTDLRHRARIDLELAKIPKIAADRPKLIQVVLNLLVNAGHAIKGSDSPVIRVATWSRAGLVAVAVEDSGCGMSKAQLARIFEPFYTTKPRGVGTGLGLSISEECVQRHAGEIHVVSELGVGSRFEVRIPLDTGLTPTEVGEAVEHASTPRRARVLVIDDEVMIRRALKRVLEPPHVVVEATSGVQALEILRRDVEFDVILCDLMMPEVDGPEVHRRVAIEFPELLDRMVFLTGGVFTERAKAFLETARPTVYEKPVPSSTLRSLIAERAANE